MTTAVLHVDDDPAFLELSEASFAHLDASVDLTTASNATEASALLAERTFDCIVSDYVMAPDGTAFVETVGTKSPDTPLILFSGKDLDDLPDPSVRQYLTDSIQKGDPDVFAELVERIHEHTTQSRMRSMRRAFLEGATTRNTAIRLLDVNDEPTYHLLEQVAELRDCLVEELPSLFTSVDADLLEALFAHDEGRDETGVELRFQYAGFDVLVNSDGTAFLRDLTDSLSPN